MPGNDSLKRRSPVPVLRDEACSYLRGPGDVPALRKHPHDRPARGDGALLSAARPDLSSCLLVQLPEYVPPEQIFTEYAYFSSYSDTWIEHARSYADSMIARQGLGSSNLVVELASNDGYLLQYFARRGVPVLGIEPARNVAAVALERGIPTVTEFFTADLARTFRPRAEAPTCWWPITSWPTSRI